jgi:hypothetical protein
MASSITAEKVRENRLRRMSERQGLVLRKSRRRDPRAIDYRRFYLTDRLSGEIVSGYRPGLGPEYTLDEIERYLTSEDR